MRLIDADELKKKNDNFMIGDGGELAKIIMDGFNDVIDHTPEFDLNKALADERAKLLKEIDERSVCFQGEETFGKKTKVLLFTEEAFHLIFG